MRGVKTQGKTACLHCVVQFPTKLIDGNDEQQQELMLAHAARFVNRFHGGDAVFAARLDRDEKGQHVVDVFAMPKYDFHYKDGRTAKKASVSKFAKQAARERFGKDDPRAQGSALQDAWFDYMREEMGLDVLRPTRKKTTTKDRLEPEEYGLQRDRERFERDKQAFIAEATKRAKALKAGEQKLQQDRQAAAGAKLKAEAIISAARDEAQLILAQARPIKARAEAELDGAFAFRAGLEKVAEDLGDKQTAEKLRKAKEAMMPKRRKPPGKQRVR